VVSLPGDELGPLPPPFFWMPPPPSPSLQGLMEATSNCGVAAGTDCARAGGVFRMVTITALSTCFINTPMYLWGAGQASTRAGDDPFGACRAAGNLGHEERRLKPAAAKIGCPTEQQSRN